MRRLTELWHALRARPLLLNSLVALLVFVPVAFGPPSEHRGAAEPLSGAGLAIGVLVCAALAVRRRWPRAVVAITVAGVVANMAIGGARNTPLDIVPAVAVAGLAAHGSRRAGWTAGAIVALVLAGVRIAFSGAAWWGPEVAGQIAWIGMAAAAGDALRSRRAYVAAIEERAERAERTREEEARRRVMEERLRIARELHDVLAHHIVLINVQAQVAEHVLAREPRQAGEALGHIRRAGRSALDELRATVGLLRQPGTAEEAPTEPAPGLDRLPELIDAFAAAGMAVGCQVDGPARPLPFPVELTAFRIVQEALTNVGKHAGRATTRVRLRYGPADLAVEVTDDGRGGPPGPAPGHGLVGMRERALSVGGTFQAGPAPGRGFRVRAVLPAPAVEG
ncbi:sensor histidine kinase [Sphaerisporangium rufum]|uniref:sensor histidine kinase n=1 Tax=Sphaerisporangium rufum TaxID=1381558 RepID=UPI001950D1C6|nr:histidine kinase [Sphaerisporangium rufum]